LCAIDPLAIGFPYAQTVIRVTRDSTAFKKPEDKTPGYYLSSERIDRYTPEQWLGLIRGHWGGIEIRNHWRKDACLFEDKTRSRNPNIVACLALLRNCLFHFLDQDSETHNINAFTEAVAADAGKAFRMVTRAK
jgi:hypothetical protein